MFFEERSYQEQNIMNCDGWIVLTEVTLLYVRAAIVDDMYSDDLYHNYNQISNCTVRR